MCLKSTSFELKVVGNVSPTMAAAVCGRLRDHNTRQDCLQMPAETKYRCARGINRRRTWASVGNIIGVGGNVVRKWGRAKRPRAGDAAITPAKRRARAKPETVQLRLPRWVAIFLRLLQDCWLSFRPRRLGDETRFAFAAALKDNATLLRFEHERRQRRAHGLAACGGCGCNSTSSARMRCVTCGV